MIVALNIFERFASNTPCTGGGFLGFSPWYKYLPGITDSNGLCSPQINSISDIWLIVAAIIEILSQLILVLAFFYLIYGSIVYMTSQGNPESVGKGKRIIQNGLIGVVIAFSAALVINFIATSIK